MGLDTICLVTLTLTILGNAETRHTAASDHRMRIPTRTILVVIRGSGNERKLVVLAKPRFIPIPNRRQLNANATKTGNNVGGATIGTSETSQMSHSLFENPKILSPDVGLSNLRRLGIRSGIRGQPLGQAITEPLSRHLPPIRVSDKPVPGLEINARGSFGNINIPKLIEAVLNTLREQSRQMSRDINEQHNHDHVNTTDTVMGHNIKLDSTDLTPATHRAASMAQAAARVLGSGIQTVPASRHMDVKGTNEPNLHSRGDQVPVGPVGFVHRLAQLKISNSLRHQPSGGEKLNIADAVPLHVLEISSSQGMGLSSQSSSISALSMNNTSKIERQLTISSASVADNSSDHVGLNNGAVTVEPIAHAGKVLIAEPYSANVDNNGVVPPTVVKSVTGESASAGSISSSSSSKRSTKVIHKAVTKKTFIKTRVISAKTNTVAASAVGGDPAFATANIDIYSTGSTGYMPPAAASTNQSLLRGSIMVQKGPNGKTEIILKDYNNNPIVLQATGPVQIQRIVTPNGGIKFIVNPIRQPPMEEGEIEDDEIPTTTTVVAVDGEPPAGSRAIATPEAQEAAQITTTTSLPLYDSYPFYNDDGSESNKHMDLRHNYIQMV